MRVVLVHGFTQTGRSWDTVAGTLRSAGHDVVAPDLPGHGDADAPSPGDDLWSVAAALRDRERPEARPVAYVGYSFGGRVALHAALLDPPLDRLVLLGAHPGIADEAERAARRLADDALADRIERIGVDAFLTEWLSQPLFAGLAGDAADVGDRRRNTAAGLAGALRRLGTGRQEPLWDRLASLPTPTLVLAGEHDHRYVEIARRTGAAIGDRATVAVVPGAGHAAHLERPEAFADVVLPFLD